MTLCTVNGGHCRCQPDEGTPCPYVPELRKAVIEFFRASTTIEPGIYAAMVRLAREIGWMHDLRTGEWRPRREGDPC